MSVVHAQHPWRPTLRVLFPDILGVLLTALISVGVVIATPLKGKLGFAIALVFSALVVSWIINFARKDRKAAFNAVTSILIYMTGTFLVIPVASILIEIVLKGFPGLTFSMFAHDMSVTAADAPPNEGGLLVF